MRPQWWKLERGDVDATIANVGFNLAQVIIPVLLLAPIGIPPAYALTHLLPGYGLGLLTGSLGFLSLAARLARREDRRDVTAHVYGNNVPAILSYTLLIILPVFVATHDPRQAWQMGAAAVLWTGLIKLAAAPFAGFIRQVISVPASMTVFGAAMYSYLGMVLLQRIFAQPLMGLVALAIVLVSVLGRVPITPWRLPPFLIAWIVPLGLGLAMGTVHPVWQPGALTLPWAAAEPWRALWLVLPFMSVIAPLASYEVLQDIAATEGAAAAGDNYDARAVVACDALGTLSAGLAGSVVCPVVYAMHPSYKAMGARLGFALWTPVIVVLVLMLGLANSVVELFPWPILAAMVAYVSVGVGLTTLARVDRKHHAAVLLGFLLPAGAVVSTAMNSALAALRLGPANATVESALGSSIYWPSVQALGNGFLFLVLIVAAIVTEVIERRFGRAAGWCGVGTVFSWLGLMHSSTARWGAQPVYAAGWLAAAIIVYSARWWGGQPEKAREHHQVQREAARLP